jgi:hypothetical protein
LTQSKEEEERQQSILKRLQISEEWVRREPQQEFTIPLAERENNTNSVGIYLQKSGAVNKIANIAPALSMSNGIMLFLMEYEKNKSTFQHSYHIFCIDEFPIYIKSHRGINVDHRIDVDQHSKPRNKCKHSINKI